MAATTSALTPARAPLAPAALPQLLPALWRDPHTVPAEELKGIIRRLETACAEHPESPDLHTCLGMAHAMNHDAYKSMDVLESARDMAPEHFWSQAKLAELFYRLRALSRAEQETLRALDLAQDPWQAALVRRQLQEIRRLMREGTQKPAWTKSLTHPAAWLLFGLAATCLLMVMNR